MKFYVGIGRFGLLMGESSSLKDKRRVVKSLLDRLGNSRMVAASEVGGQDSWKSGTVAVTCVSGSMDLVRGTLEKARRTIESSGVEVIDAEQWILKPEDLDA
ncbi:MAG: DUF503 domain-containing protein [Actinomycetota bacterium]